LTWRGSQPSPTPSSGAGVASSSSAMSSTAASQPLAVARRAVQAPLDARADLRE
jgi:hypothetical protein